MKLDVNAIIKIALFAALLIVCVLLFVYVGFSVPEA